MNQANQPPGAPGRAGDDQSTTLRDVQQLGMFAAIASLSYVFWVVGAMEMVERLAFYGVRAITALYVTASAEEGGLGIPEVRLAYVFTAWAVVQSFFPVFTGVLSDRYGYKETIFASTVIKILGYLIMGIFPSFAGFFCGVVVLALGTAIFKPGIQGTLVKCTTRRNSSIAWGIFYQTVNIGGWLGPLVASFLRDRAWGYIFYACAGIISLNFFLLLTYREVGKEDRLADEQTRRVEGRPRANLLMVSLRELAKPHVAIYLAIFSGFWFMFNALFDVLPLHIRDWVDTGDIISFLFGDAERPNAFVAFLVGANRDGTAIDPEGMLNLNAGIIMLTCFVFAAISAKLRATTSMVIGTLLASLAMFMCGWAQAGWASLGAIAIFSVGEMLSSPKFSEFIGNFAPRDKKAMYLGFSQIPIAVGWTLESYFAPTLYGIYAAKDRLVRGFLERHAAEGHAVMPSAATFDAWSQVRGVELTAGELIELFEAEPIKFVEQIPQGEAFNWATQIAAQSPEMLAELPGGAALAANAMEPVTTMPTTTQATEALEPVAHALTDFLRDTHSVGNLWYLMLAIGVVSAIGIYMYGRWVLTLSLSHDGTADE